ncbi:MAG TPA: DUF3352 domain-containing protein, partial [Actinomycetota bacterium]|nr:DUF3352 domain-containing protein [Actinomycetota bacterium]
LLKRFPQTEEGFSAARDDLLAALDPILGQIGLGFERDIDPWLGDQVAFYLLPPDAGEDPSSGAVLLSIDGDEEAALDAVEKALSSSPESFETDARTYEGIDYNLVRSEVLTQAVFGSGATSTASDEGPLIAYGVVDEHLVFGSNEAFRASVDARDGDALEFTTDFKEATDGFADDRVALVYLQNGTLFDSIESSGIDAEGEEALDILREQGADGGSALALRATADALVMEASAVLEDDSPAAELGDVAGPDLLEGFPKDAWLALGVTELGQKIRSALDLASNLGMPGDPIEDVSAAFEAETGLDLQDDVLAWLGDTGLFVRGRTITDIGGALVVESTDPDRTGKVVDALRDLVEAEQPGLTQDVEREGLSGFTFRFGPTPPINVLGGDRLVIAYGGIATDAVLSPEETLDDSERYGAATDALGRQPALYLDLAAVLELVEAFSPDAQGDRTYQTEVKPILEQLSFLAVSGHRDGDVVYQQLVIGAK